MNAAYLDYFKENAPYVREMMVDVKDKKAITQWDLYCILIDGHWHTGTELATKCGKSLKYAQEIVRMSAEDWNIVRSRQKGYCIDNYYLDKTDRHPYRKKWLELDPELAE